MFLSARIFNPWALPALCVLAELSSALAAPSPPSGQTPRPPGAIARPSAEELRRAADRHDAVELERLSRRLGAARLAALVERASPPTRDAALAGLALVDDGLLALPRLLALCERAEIPAALQAQLLDATRRITERAARGEIDLEELPPDLPRAAADSLAALAAREDRAIDVRVSAVGALAQLIPLVARIPERLGALATARDPSLRRAVADALPATSTQILVKLLTDDGTDAVAAAAAGALCREVPPPGAEKKGDRALRRAVELPAAARARLRTLATNAALDEGDRLDVIPCLRPSAQGPLDQKADLEVLQSIARGPDGALKHRARAYGAR